MCGTHVLGWGVPVHTCVHTCVPRDHAGAEPFVSTPDRQAFPGTLGRPWRPDGRQKCAVGRGPG